MNLNKAEKSLYDAIIAWHREDRQISIRRTFELGDMIVNATICARITEYQVINRIMEMLGELAHGMTCYNRAARLARVFTKNQREVLIEHAVSLVRAEILAGAAYDGRRRVKIIDEIKRGKIKAPWTCIVGRNEAIRSTVAKGLRSIEKELPEDSTRNPDNVVIQLSRGGDIEEDSVVDAMRNIISRVGKTRAVTLWSRALAMVKA